MLKSLLIKNFALIEHASISLTKGLNIITGESGAGKSILVNAISQLCGERSNFDFIKSGAKKAVIEAEIDLHDHQELIPFLQQNDIEIDNNLLIIRKEISQSGTSRIFVNDTPVQLTILEEISAHLIDLHGQHQHQVLLHPENHLPYLDSFANLQSSVRDFTNLVKEYQKKLKKRAELQNEQANALQMTDLYTFQLDELSKANLREGELDELKDELKILTNYEKLNLAAQNTTDRLSLGEINAAQLITEAEDYLQRLAEIDPQFNEFSQNLTSARQVIEEIGQFCERYLGNLEFDADRAEFLRQRIAQLEFLLKKYQKEDLNGLIDLNSELQSKLSDIENFDKHLQSVDNEIIQIEKIILNSGQELSIKRREAAREFEQKLSHFLEEIGMSNSRFEFVHSMTPDKDSPFAINGQKCRLSKTGFDEVLIQFSPNPGETLKAINKIASGGEISRIMLALKSVLAEKDQVPVLVFDEIDSGISGKVAQIVGKKISDLSRYHQIICITHLPQIAAFADHHLKVDKKTAGNITEVQIKALKFDDQVSELAHLLGGVSVSQQALDNAAQLLSEAAKIK
ncbi:MAG: DNA repair protein RecN [Calditrichae bacterium]|nr:DNA repair protein RecN [Calditrichia bacterium]